MSEYRYYQFLYQVGVFLSRSSVKFFQIKKLWLVASLQFVNLVFFWYVYFVLHLIYWFFENCQRAREEEREVNRYENQMWNTNIWDGKMKWEQKLFRVLNGIQNEGFRHRLMWYESCRLNSWKMELITHSHLAVLSCNRMTNVEKELILWDWERTSIDSPPRYELRCWVFW